MKTIGLLLLIGFSIAANGQSIENGKSIFNTNCKACHSVGGGKLVGPDLAGLLDRRDQEWVTQFIRNSSELIASGDEQAVAVFNEYNKITMPPHPFSEPEMQDLIAYLNSYEEKAEEPAVSEVSIEKPADQVVVQEAVAIPFWVKAFLSGTLLISIVLLTVIGFLIKMVRGM